MAFSNVGFIIDNVGEQSTGEDPKNSSIQSAFEEFMKERNAKIAPQTTKEEKETPFTQFSKKMNLIFPTHYYEHKKNAKRPTYKVDIEEFKKDKSKVQQLLAKSAVLQPDFEELKQVPSQVVSEKKLKLQRKAEREKTKGTKWFNMPATEVTEELKNDLQVLKMRSVLDPKHFYKKNDLKVLPKYFQVGKVQDSPLDFYNNRLTKKERKKTLVDELLADAEFAKYNKKKYTEILVEKQKTHYKAYRQARRLKRKGKK